VAMSLLGLGLIWMASLVLLLVVWCLSPGGIHGTLLLSDFLTPLLTALLVSFLNGTLPRSDPQSSILTALFRLYHTEWSGDRKQEQGGAGI
jgi:hypothetical protein